MTATTSTKKRKTGTKRTDVKKSRASKPQTQVKKISALDAAAKVLAEQKVPMTCQELIGVMAAKGYWSSPAGKTPAATLSAGIIKEIEIKGTDSRFAKTAPGRFAARCATGTARNPAKNSKSKTLAQVPKPATPDGTHRSASRTEAEDN